MSKTPELMSVTDFAKLKKCSRQTVYNNVAELTIIKIGWNNIIVMDEKAANWNPKEKMKRSNQHKRGP